MRYGNSPSRRGRGDGSARYSQSRDYEGESRLGVNEIRCDSPSDRGQVQATRLFDKLDQLEKRWQSQKSQQRKCTSHPLAPQASSEREQPPEACLTATFSTAGTFESSSERPIGRSGSFADQRAISRSGSFTDQRHIIDPSGSFADQRTMSRSESFTKQRHIGRSDSFASTISAKSERSRKKKAPRIVSMFDRLYQKGKVKSINRGRAVHSPTKPKGNRNKRRQNAATAIQAAVRGRKLRKKLEHSNQIAAMIQKWWREVSDRLFFLRLRGSTIVLQSLARRRKALQNYQLKLKAVILIQSRQRVNLAKHRRLELTEERERRIHESNASLLIQGMMMKNLKVLRQQRVDCKSLIVEETPSDELEQNESAEEVPLKRTPSDEIGQLIKETEKAKGESEQSAQPDSRLSRLRPPRLELTNASSAVINCERERHHEGSSEEETTVVTEHTRVGRGSHRATLSPRTESPCPPPAPTSASAALYRAAQFRRRALRHASLDASHTPRPRSSPKSASQTTRMRDATPERARSCTPRKYRSIAYEYLPTRKTYWAYDAQKATKIPILQRWARRQIEHRRRRRALVGIQCAWRTYRAQFYLISYCLLKQWSVRVDFHQEETTSNPILRQKVRLLALTNAIRQVNDECIRQDVLRTPYSFLVSWKTEASIYFGEDRGMAELHRCSIHVICEAHRHPLWDSWSSQKKFTLLSKAALMKSFANQCARLSRASVLMQSLKMRRILLNMAREKEAARTIQRFWKQYGQEIGEMKFLETVRFAAIRLQSWWRMTMCIYTIEIQDMSACSIQAFYRGYMSRKYYIDHRRQIVLLQSVYRGRRQRAVSRLESDSAVCIQRATRGLVVRLMMHKQAYAALAIQDLYRAVALRLCMSKIRLSYSTLQCLVQRQAILSRLQAEQSSVRLQSWWRMSIRRVDFFNNIQSIITVQALHRGLRARKHFKTSIMRFTRVQAMIRGREARLTLCLCVQAATKIQSWWRKTIASETYRILFLSALDIQRLSRGYQIRKQHKKLMLEAHKFAAAIWIQAWWRMVIANEKYSELCMSAIDTQRLYRGFKARQQCQSVRKTRLASVNIQRVYRGSKARKTCHILVELRLFATSIQLQAWWRKILVGLKFSKEKQQALEIQKIFRSLKARDDVHQARLNRSAKLLQACWRRHFELAKYVKMSVCSVLLQKVYRGYEARRRYKAHLEANVAAAAIQLVWDQYRDRRAANLYNAIVLVQKAYRGYQVRQRINPIEVFFHSKGTACRYLDRRRFSNHRQLQLSALRIQSWWRRALAAVKIQSWYRMARALEDFEEILVASIIIQTVFRGSVVRMEAEKDRQTAVVIQSCYRRLMKKRQTNAAVVIQSWRRAIVTKRRLNAALAIQSWRRATIAQRRQHAAVALQSWNRMVRIKHRFDRIRIASTVIQSFHRANVASSMFRKQMAAVVKIQSFWRSYLCVLAVAKLRQYLTSFQARFRGSVTQWEIGAALIIQRWYLARKAELYRQAVNAAAHQRACRRQDTIISEPSVSIHDLGDENSAVAETRGYQLCSIFTFPADKTELSATTVQTMYRTYACRQAYLKFRSAVIKIQISWRVFLDQERNICTRAVVHDEGIEVQRMARPQQVVWLKKLRTLAAILVQSWWRGKTQRRRYLLVRGELLEQQKLKALVASSSTIESELDVSEVVKAANTSSTETEKIALPPPFATWLFDPEVVLSLPVSLASCLDSVQTSNMLCGEKKTKTANIKAANIYALKIQRWWLTHIKNLKSKETYPMSAQATMAEMANQKLLVTEPITRVQVRNHLRLIVSSASLLQTWWKLRLQRIYEAKMVQATKIQSNVRRAQASELVLRLKSTVVIQSHCRAFLAKAKYDQMRKGFSSLQREWLRYARLPEFRARIEKRDRGITTLQGLAKQQFQDKTASAIRLQRQWRLRRGFISLQRVVKKRFKMKTRAVCLLQRNWRMFQARSDFIRSKCMATCVQSQWRRFRSYVAFKKQRVGLIHLQLLWAQKFQRRTHAAKCVQRQWRMTWATSTYLQQCLSAALISKAWRRYSCWAAYRRIHSGFVLLQEQAKARSVKRTKCAILLQRSWRMHSKRREFARNKEAAALLQKTWRMQKLRRCFKTMVLGTISIQRFQRRVAVRSRYCTLKKGLLFLQEKAKQKFQYKTKAAVILQRRHRMKAASSKYATHRIAAIKLQTQWRLFSAWSKYITIWLGFCSMQEIARRSFEIKTASAVLLQRSTRMFFARTHYRLKRLGAILVQRQWRRRVCERRFKGQLQGFSAFQLIGRQHYKQKQRSATVVQANWRMTTARFDFKEKRAAAIVLQTHSRGASCKSAYAIMRPGFISLQVLAKLWFRIKKTCAVQIQAATRGMLCRKRYQRLLRSVVRVQSVFRGFVQRRNLVVLRWLHSIAATMIASWWRRISCEYKYQSFRYATIVLQTGLRRSRRERAAVRLQRWWRSRCAAQRYQQARNAAIVIEYTIRTFLANSRRRHAAASVIQKSWVESQQRFLVRCLLVLGRAKAAIALQRWWRNVLVVRRYRKLLSDVKKRKMEAARRQKHKKDDCDPITMFCSLDFGKLATSCTMLPWGAEATNLPVETVYNERSQGRSHHHHRDARLRPRAAILIQRQWRQFRRSRAKEYYYRSISAAWVQCIWRGYSARKRYNVLLGNKAATSLQIAWQNIQQRHVETKQVMLIQARWRMCIQKWKYADIQIIRQICSTMIQSAWRMHCRRQSFLKVRAAAFRVQDVARKNMKRNEAARKIQCAWWAARLRGTGNNRKSRIGTSLPAMVLQAGVAWIQRKR